MFPADLDTAFTDWGQTVTLRVVTQTFDPQTQQVAENVSETSVTAVVGPEPAAPNTPSAGQHLQHERSFLVRAADLPADAPRRTTRVVFDDTEYEVTALERSPDELAVTLTTRRRT